MSPALVGGLIGLVLGVANYAVLMALSRRVALAETVQVLRIAALADLVVFPGAGYLIGAFVWN